MPARGLIRLVLALPPLLAAVGCTPMSLLITPVPGGRDLVEFELERDGLWAADRIAVVEVEGAISGGRGTTLLGAITDDPVAVFAEKLDKAADDERVKAVVLRVNSPGGGVTASERMHAELLRFRRESGKPIVTSMLDVAASGGYYIACATDRILAMSTTVTGSIGVLMILPDLSGTMQMIGARANVIKSAPLKDAGSPFRPLGDQERAVFQGIIDSMYERFVEVVVGGRPNLDETAVRRIADGRVYTARQALEHGLIDEIGDLRAAIETARDLAGLDAGHPLVVVSYARPSAWRPNIHADAPPVNLVNVNLPDWLSADGPQFLYLWAPGW